MQSKSFIMLLRKIATLLILPLFILIACNTPAGSSNLSVADFEKAIAKNNIQLLDVRTTQEYQSGHLKNALQADWNNTSSFQERVAALNKTVPVYTYCLSGARSNAATEWLNANGFKAFNMDGGLRAWQQEGKTVEQLNPAKQISLQEYLAQIPADKTVLVDFSAEWCPPCKKMIPTMDSLVNLHGSQFVLVKIDGAVQTAICNEMKIENFPTFVVYKEGKEVWRNSGILSMEALLQHL